MTERETPSEPWLQPVDGAVSSVREFFSDLFAGNRDEMYLAFGVLAVPIGVMGAFVGSFSITIMLLFIFAMYMGMICLWAARSKQGLPQFIRGSLFSFGVLWIVVTAILFYGLVKGYSIQQTPIEQFEAAPSSYERPDPRWIS